MNCLPSTNLAEDNMIDVLKKRHETDICLLLSKISDEDFYFTQNNQRVSINTLPLFRTFNKECTKCYGYFSDSGDLDGVLSIWKSCGNNINRYYIKVLAKDSSITKKLIQVLIWNYNKELFIKVNKKHPFLQVYNTYGFKFMGDRGREILLRKEPREVRPVINKEEEND